MRVLDLFCGAGLAHRGFPASAVSVGVDLDADAIDSFRHHLGSEHCSALLADLSDPDVRARIVEAYPAPDLVWASPPCQPFSAAGSKRGAEDSRNGYPWTLDVLRRLVEASKRPRLVVIENVRGLTFHRCARGLDRCNGCYLDEQICELERLFSYVRPYTVNAANFGTPQIRRRVVVLCSDDLSLVQPPTPTHNRPDQVLQYGRLPWVTMREALPHLDEECSGWTLDGGRNSAANPGQERVTQPEEPAPAISTRGNQVVRYADQKRRLTVEECALLQGLEHDPTLPTQTKRSRYRQVGNGVPPQLVRAVISGLL